MVTLWVTGLTEPSEAEAVTVTDVGTVTVLAVSLPLLLRVAYCSSPAAKLHLTEAPVKFCGVKAAVSCMSLPLIIR